MLPVQVQQQLSITAPVVIDAVQATRLSTELGQRLTIKGISCRKILVNESDPIRRKLAASAGVSAIASHTLAWLFFFMTRD